MAALLTTPTGKIHEFSKLEDAVRTFIIATDDLDKSIYKSIVQTISRDGTQVYRHNGWTVGMDTTVRRKGKVVFVTNLKTNERVQYDTIKQASAVLGISASQISKTMDSINNTYNGYRFEHAPTTMMSNSIYHPPQRRNW